MAKAKKKVTKKKPAKKATKKPASRQKKVSVKSKATKTTKRKPVSVIEIDMVPPKPKGNLVGSWAFIIGFIIAIITGIASMWDFASNEVLIFLLITCGILIGFLNIRDHESKEFMIAGAILVFMCWLGLATINKIEVYANILYALQTLFIPATIIVALRSLFVLGHR